MASYVAAVPANERRAAIYMLVSVVVLSLAPLFFSLGKSAASPFLFTVAWRIGVASGCLLYASAVSPKLTFDHEVIAPVLHRLNRWPLLLAVLGNCDFALFAWASRFIDVSAVTVVFNVWPILFIILVGWLYRRDNRYQSIDRRTAVFLAMAFVGVTFVVFAQAGSAKVFGQATADAWRLMLGRALAIGSAVLAPSMAFGIRWSSDLTHCLSFKHQQKEGHQALELFYANIAFFISSAGAAVLSATAGWLTGETPEMSTLAIGFAGGLLTNATAGILWRKSTLITSNLNINALGYLSPVFSLGFLGMFSMVNIPRVDYLIIGAITIVLSNVLVNITATRRQRMP